MCTYHTHMKMEENKKIKNTEDIEVLPNWNRAVGSRADGTKRCEALGYFHRYFYNLGLTS